MKLNHGLHLAYCTNIHRGESWDETFAALQKYTLAVRDRVQPRAPYAIGLRLSDLASRELSEPAVLSNFRSWLDRENCYVFTINGFPFGKFHGGPVKERVYQPDWSTPERLAYTNRLFDLLAQLVPPGVEGSVSTVPGSFKAFQSSPEARRQMRQNLWTCARHLEALSEASGRVLHLGLEPEPLCLFETTPETVQFFDELFDEFPNDPQARRFIGVNYDTCHLAVEFEEPAAALGRLRNHGIKISKLHLSSALKMRPSPEALAAAGNFTDEIYLHQVVARSAEGQFTRYTDLPDALAAARHDPQSPFHRAADAEWRVHFHIPLHSPPQPWFQSTSDHLLGALDFLQQDPRSCSHLEMETYTWEVLPAGLKGRDVVDQLVGEYAWTLERLAERGLATRP